MPIKVCLPPSPSAARLPPVTSAQFSRLFVNSTTRPFANIKHIRRSGTLELDWVVEEVIKKEIHSRKQMNRARGQYAAAKKRVQEMERESEVSAKEEWDKAQQLKCLRTGLDTTEAELKQFKNREVAMHIRETDLLAREVLLKAPRSTDTRVRNGSAGGVRNSAKRK